MPPPSSFGRGQSPSSQNLILPSGIKISKQQKYIWTNDSFLSLQLLCSRNSRVRLIWRQEILGDNSKIKSKLSRANQIYTKLKWEFAFNRLVCIPNGYLFMAQLTKKATKRRLSIALTDNQLAQEFNKFYLRFDCQHFNTISDIFSFHWWFDNLNLVLIITELVATIEAERGYWRCYGQHNP